MVKIIASVLIAAWIRDLVRWEAQKLRWRMEVNKFITHPTPWKNQIVRMLAGEKTRYGEE